MSAPQTIQIRNPAAIAVAVKAVKAKQARSFAEAAENILLQSSASVNDANANTQTNKPAAINPAA